MKLLNALNIKTQEGIFVFVLGLAILIRATLTFLLEHWTSLSLLADGLYVFLFYFNIVGGFFLLSKLFRSGEVDIKAFFYRHQYYWAAISVLVPVVTWLSDSEYYINIDYFKNIPFFLQDNNYLPSGLLFILPLLVIFFTKLAKQYYSISLLNILLMLLVVIALNYIVFYQWILYASYFSKTYYSYQVGISVYGVLALGFSFPCFYFMYKKLQLHVNWLYGYGIAAYFFIFLGLTRIFYYFMLKP